jgi:hypothetical protein
LQLLTPPKVLSFVDICPYIAPYICEILEKIGFLLQTRIFWPRVRAHALRATRLFGLINTSNGALRAPTPLHIAASLLLIHLPNIEKYTISRNKMLSFTPLSGRQGHISFQ